jgi:hypothetical protein
MPGGTDLTVTAYQAKGSSLAATDVTLPDGKKQFAESSDAALRDQIIGAASEFDCSIWTGRCQI